MIFDTVNSRPVSDSSFKCRKHDKKIKFYCGKGSCKEFLCTLCLFDGGHSEHRKYVEVRTKEQLFDDIRNVADVLDRIIDGANKNK